MLKRLLSHKIKSHPFLNVNKNRFLSSHYINYDYIIVGGGSAGCTLAFYLRLFGKSVAIIEAGFNLEEHLPQMKKRDVPLFLGYNMFDDRVNYCYNSSPQQHMNNRIMYCPRGKGVGGSSAINGMVYVRGHPFDYDRWHREGAKNWSYKDCLPYFKLIENCQFDADANYRSKIGPLELTRVNESVQCKLIPNFFDACESTGLPKTDDFNGFSQFGFGYYDRTIFKQQRNDTGRAFLSFYVPREIMKTYYASIATKINFDGNKAVSITAKSLDFPEHDFTLSPREEIILCTGAIDTPKLLMLSGIGDESHLTKHGIKVVHHLPGVGQNLQDHLEFYIQHKTNSRYTLHSLAHNPLVQAIAGLKYLLNYPSPLGSAHLDSGAFTFTSDKQSHPDVQIHFFPSCVIDHGKKIPDFNCFQIHIGTMRGHSKGSVTLASANFTDPPIIDFNYLSDDRDLEDLVKCIDIGRNIMAQPAMSSVSTGEISPGPDCKTLSDMRNFVRNNAQTAYHPSCTCKMGADDDKMAVLDSECRVRGVENLRVVDASAFPSITSGNLNAPVIMLAAKVARSIVYSKPLDPQDVPCRETNLNATDQSK